MTEIELQYINLAKIVWLAGYATLYGFGGIKGKWKRRFVGSAFLTFGVCASAYASGLFSWWLLLFFPLLATSLSMGYGADDPIEKIKRRSLVGLALGLSALPIAIVSQMWGLFIAHMILSFVASVSLGVFNYSRSARDEETLIAAFSGILPLFMV